METEKCAWEEEKLKLATTHKFESKIKLDVGGTPYTTSLTTLCRFPESMLGWVVDLSPAHVEELKREAEYFGLDDVMFPFKPAPPVYLQDGYRHNSYAITQNEKKLWCATDVDGYSGNVTSQILTVCNSCKCAQFGVYDDPAYFASFAATREIVSTQPCCTSMDTCFNCGVGEEE
eukprot:gene24602-30967_t